jgi:TPR repeat protein
MEARRNLDALEDEEGWRLAELGGTIEAYREYLRHRPTGSHVLTARQRLVGLEEAHWLNTQAADSLEGYRRFLATWTDSRHGAEARKRLSELEDDEMWRQAQRTGTLPAIRAYLKANPSGRHTSLALQKRATLEDDEAWSNAKSSDAAVQYRAYIHSFPNGRYASDAKQRLTELDEAAWKQARSTSTIESIEQYLNEWSDGRFIVDARRLMDDFGSAQECDKLAANPDDPAKVTLGVPFRELVPIPAIAACQKALHKFPQVARFKYQLARAYQKSTEPQRAVHLFRELVQVRYLAAYDNLGWMYVRGQGVSKNPTEAARLFRLGADSGLVESMHSLGMFHELVREYDQARIWYQKAAQNGYTPAQEAVRRLNQQNPEIPNEIKQLPGEMIKIIIENMQRRR